ncbi:Myblike DNAbinding domain-containing protein [Mortierella hygrophila]|uniref:Myblike DNAbinding domain-containing protein n=1 Tax=Mortierella hygrophila TaxID=979708 RepID=A0A9P6F2S9_9FUNG|nr:Myblike DNAbinding domain-containing protein [Mortierella hygrophila]
MSTYAGDTSGKGKGKQGSSTSISSTNNNRNEITLSLLDDLGAMSDGYDVDVDDLLSDESENDDLIDNEADLALLLRTHGVTLDDPPPPPAVSRGMGSNYFATTMLAPGASQSAFLPGGPGPSTATAAAPRFQDPSDAQNWMAAMEKRYEEELHQQQASPAQPTQSLSFVYIHSHGSTSQSRVHSSESSPTIPMTVAPKCTLAVPTTSPARAYAETGMEGDIQINNRDSAQADLQQDGGNATRAYASTTQAAPAPEPFVMDPEENKRLTGVIRSQTANALEVNRKYQLALEQKLRDIEQAHSRNKKLRDELQVWLDRRNITERAPVVLPSSNDRLGPPYFVDEDENTPPSNMDTLRKKSHPLIVSQKRKYWSVLDRANLRQGVIAENKRLLFEKFLREGNSQAIESLNNAPEVDMMLNTKGLDWKRISQRYVDNRTPSECLIQWTSHDHPGINKNDWSKAELLKLDSLVKQHKGRNWIQIALDLNTNRTGAQCFQKYQSKMVGVSSKDNWTAEEDNILREAVRVLGEKNWLQVASCLGNRNSVQCMTRWSKSVNPAIRRGRWLKEEDGALRAAYEVYGGGRWAKIQQHVLGRTDIQCRERYVNVLTPNLATGPWTQQEVERLDELVKVHGEKWGLIASLMNGRTDNQCARRWRMNKEEDKQKRKGRPSRRYLASRRRKGTSTVAALPTVHKDKEAIEKTMHLKKKWERRILKREMKILRAKGFFDGRKNKRIKPLYKSFLERERFIYDCWQQQWGDHIDPVEKVFNLGIPPPITTNKEPPQGRGDQSGSVFDAVMPDPASVARPGKVRPVPPCNATLTAFSNLVQQGDLMGGRFQLAHTISVGKTSAAPVELLSAEEQMTPEHKELEERFEAVFTWPLLAGMLHMETARNLVNHEQTDVAAAAEKRQSRARLRSSQKGYDPSASVGSLTGGGGVVGAMESPLQRQDDASSSAYGTPVAPWQEQSEMEDVESSEYETDNDGDDEEHVRRAGGREGRSTKRLRIDH